MGMKYYLLNMQVRDTQPHRPYNCRWIAIIPAKSDEEWLVPHNARELIHGIGFDCGWIINECDIHTAITDSVAECSDVTVTTKALADKRPVTLIISFSQLHETVSELHVPEQEEPIVLDMNNLEYLDYYYLLEDTNEFYQKEDAIGRLSHLLTV